jgi:hypothetical protein
MLTWKQTLIAYLNGYSYAITEGDEPDDWGVEITTPDGDMDVKVCNTIEEAKEYCERTAAEVQE